MAHQGTPADRRIQGNGRRTGQDGGHRPAAAAGDRQAQHHNRQPGGPSPGMRPGRLHAGGNGGPQAHGGNDVGANEQPPGNTGGP